MYVTRIAHQPSVSAGHIGALLPPLKLPPGMRSGGRGRGNWQRFQQQQYGQQHGGYAPQGSYRQQQSNQQQPPVPANASQVQRDIVSFIEAFRANQSSPAAPPNALTLDVVVRAICSHFRVNAFEELMGTSALQLPALRQLHTVNQRVWTFVTCFMQSRRINTLFECHQAFLQHEGLRSFHELKIGNSFLHSEAVQQLYYSPMTIVTITTRDVLSSLRQFEEMLGHDAFRASSRIDLNEFLQYLAQQYRQPSAQAMGIAIDPNGFGVYVGMLRRVANHEMKEMKTLEQQFQREVAEKMFRLTKEKFSDDNRKQALEELLENTKTRTESENGFHSKREAKNSNMKSLSLDMLKRVTDVDVYLDNVLRRKAAADAKNQQKLRKPISSQEIAETDSKLRTQMTRFLVASQKSRYHSRLKVVTWVICSIMAKTYALLLSDDKLPDEDAEGELETAEVAESDKEECDCCCVGKESCTCSCTCKCHVESSDEEEEDDDEETKDEQPKTDADKFPVMPTDPFASRFAKLNKQVEVTLEDVKTEVDNFLECKKSGENQPQTPKDVLLLLSTLEKHLLSKFTAKNSGTVLWAGRQSVLELLPELLDDTNDTEDNGSKWLLSLLSSTAREDVKTSAISEKPLQEEVLPFVRECRATIASSASLSSLPSEKQQQWIGHRVAVELGSTRAKEAGAPSIEELIQLADQESIGGESSLVKYAGSLDLNHGVSSSEGATGELEQQALEQVRKCPYLVDVSLFMDWQERYAPLCGPLLSFLRAHEMILLDHAPSANLMFVCCLNGAIVRVNEKSTASDLELLLARAQQDKSRVSASQVAVHLVSMIVTCRSEGNFPKQLVQAHLRSYLSSFAKDKTAESYPERLVLEILLETPIQFADVVVPLLLGLLTGSNEWEAADRVWKACRSDTERKTLLLASCRSSLWTNQTDKWCALRENLTATIEDTTSSSTEVTTASIKANEAKTTEDAGVFDSSASEVPVFSMEPADQEMEEISTTEKASDSCHSFIQDLRKKQFGVGLQIQDEATNSVLLIQQQRLERALKRLSDELYSESTHFVLELLQNADDNTYDDTVIPLGDFTLTKDKEIVFYNNEKGFSSTNIQAICDVGASTKAVDSDASIGKKGIGFKSVFKVSDDPQVHSNGFHICFHAKNSTHGSGMGYILPYWLEDTAKWKQRRGTTFVLPLNETSVSRVRDISRSLLAFEPSVLLFLRRIRELRLRDSVGDQTLHFLKKEKKLQNAQLVQLFSQEKKSGDNVEMTQQNWLVVKEKLTPPQFFTRHQLAEIAIAFPVALPSQEINDRPPLQQVFCYLPLRSYGFRFILQGDFEIPSSREAITNGSEWNEWLVSKFPQLVRSAVISYVLTIQQGGIVAISHLLSLLPIENEVQAPFRSIIPEIMRELRQVKWLVDASGELRSPAELIDGGDAKETLEVLGEALGKRFLHPTLSREMSASMKSQLRIEQLHASHLMRVLSLSAEKNDVDWTVKVLAQLSKLWRKDRHSSLLRQELRLIKCFPLQKSSQSDSKWVSLADGHDSLFVSNVQDDDSSESYKFFGDIRILEETFTKMMNKSSKLRSFVLTDVGIHVMEDHDLIQHHILPKVATEPERSVVLEYGRFLAAHLVKCRQCAILKDIKANLVVATTNDSLVSVESSNSFVVLPSTCREVDELISWTKTKVDDAFSIVATEYFSEDSRDEQWQKLLVDTCELPLLLDVVCLSSDARSQAGMKQLLQWIEAEEDVQVKRSISTCLAQYLDKNWQATDDSDDGVDFWRDFCWLEGSDQQFHRPTDLWLPVEKATRLFTPAMVTFSTIQWKNDAFSRLVGLKCSASVSDVLTAISSLSVGSTEVEIDQMVRMYSFLWEESQQSDLCRTEVTKAFSHNAMIVIKNRETYRFIGSKCAVWSSTAHNGELVALEMLYPKSLAEFFTEVCGVQRKPSVSFLCERITEQSYSLTNGSSKMWEKNLLPLLSGLSKKVKKHSLSKTETKEIKKTLKAAPWLPVRSISGSSFDFMFCSSKDHPVQAATDGERKLQKLLLSLAKETSADGRKGGTTRTDIKLVQLEAFGDDLDELLRFIKISTLSSHLEIHATTWCKILARLTKSPQLDKKKSKKKLIKFTQLVVKFWATTPNDDVDFQNCLQQLEIFPTIDGNLRCASADLYINDQAELPKEELQNGLQILGLFPWSYFVDSEDKETTRIRRFLTEFCGIKSLSEALQYEVSVLSSQRPASEAFHLKTRTALAVAQRFLFTSYRNLYDQLDHVSIAKFAKEFQCILVDGHDGFQVVYRVGNSFSLRRGVDVSRCFLDVSKSTLYMQFVSGDEEASELSSVLMEISRKLFGAQVAPGVANLVYLSLLQTDAQRNQWLEDTQRLPSLPEAEELWVQRSDNSTVEQTTGSTSRKRASEDMEDGEIETGEAPKKSYQLPPQYPPLPPPSTPYPPLHPQLVTGNPYQPPLPPSTQGMQSLALSNTMTKEEREAIGRWGEEYVFNQLKQQHSETESNMTVQWVNEEEESGLPYDLTLSVAGKVVEYIEVKSTRTMEKGVFEISMNELDQAAIHGSTYSIYRVFNAGNAALCRVIRMKNPVSLVRQRKIQLALVMQ
ncbi:hypothetical protein P3T76_003830 [Phytophthora citrophthora]|uniref:Protein NO VEIN C-terminal domain-containing protein n=1 Tax=Phytophthora citrophthora TaxID=4793 RepID=A0AAD9GVC1_9STRA|nr:hypothetical protein P3T76_003830 [Phytophthora citrophthora]